MTSKQKSHKLKSYIIPLNVIQEMDKMIHDTHKTGKEHGMSLCSSKKHSKNNEIRAGYKSVGTDRGISISEECPLKQKYVGTFHTHPDDSEAAASAQDLFSSCLTISNLDCVGKNEIGEIVCYDKKKKDTPCISDVQSLKEIEDIFHEIPHADLPKIRKELYNEVDKVADKHFDIHKIK